MEESSTVMVQRQKMPDNRDKQNDEE